MRKALFAVLLAACSSRPPSLHVDPQALAYRSRSKVSDQVAKQIGAEAMGDARRRPAWSEPNHVHTADGPVGDGQDKYVFGEARLYVVEYETDPGKFREVSPREDAVMAYADALFTIKQLQEWAERYGVSWDVQLGKKTGKVDRSGPDSGAQKLLAELSRRAGVDAAEAERERPQIDAKYRDRR